MDNSFTEILDIDNLPWETYKSSNASSGVLRYAIGSDFIWIEFQDLKVYRYSENSIGKSEIADMKRLAATGSGLSTFMNKQSKKRQQYEVRYEFKNGRYIRFWSLPDKNDKGPYMQRDTPETTH
jgi:hypothetical protein